MRPFFLSFCLLLLISDLFAQTKISIVPWPVEVTAGDGTYTLKRNLTVSSTLPQNDWIPLFRYFKNELKKWNINVTEAAKGMSADLVFDMRRMPTSGKPAYTIEVDQKGIRVASNFDLSTFHAMQTLFQLIPPTKTGNLQVPFVKIFDHARFEYRGMHLDVARHFFPVSFIKKYIDFLAFHKLNKFHWHLTDDQGWRIEIKKYPLLTSIGNWRNGTIIGRYPGKGNDNIKYGGFYTQNQVKEVVAYAKERFIEVIPEIEMPGHGSAAIASYPWLSCFPAKPTMIPEKMISKKSREELQKGRIKLVQETWGVFEDVFCAGNDSVFLFLQNVIDEVAPLFPSKYFHAGGDECPKTHWKQCPKCQQRMRENNLKDEHELQSYFIQRIEKHINAKGKTLIGWDEILEGGLAPNAIVMSWRGEAGGIAAAKQKHQVIMSPGNPVYFDHTQSLNEDSVTIGGYNPIEAVYAYQPIPSELSADEGKFVLGAQANVWTEYMKNSRKVEYMVFPRMSALSEILWSPKENRNWKSFEERLPQQIKRYEFLNANYSKAYYDLKTLIVPSETGEGVAWKLQAKRMNDDCEYCYIEISEEHVLTRDTTVLDTIAVLDVKNPSIVKGTKTVTKTMMEGEVFTRKLNVPNANDTLMLVPVNTSKKLVARQRWHHAQGRKYEQEFIFHKATGKAITLLEPPSAKYKGDGAFTLVNAVQNKVGMNRTQEFLGFEGTNCIAIIDLGKETEISEIAIHHLEQQGSWIYSPSAIDVAGSGDGQAFAPFASPVSLSKSPDKDKTTLKFGQPVRTRFLKVSIFNFGIIGEGLPGAGHKAWLFVDEIEVN